MPLRAMKNHNHFPVLIALLGLTLFSGSSRFARGAGSVEEVQIDIPFQRFVLTNGLTLIVHEDHKAPVVAVNVWYHVGSKNEVPGKTGFTLRTRRRTLSQ